MGVFWLFYFIDGYTSLSCVAVILLQTYFKDQSNTRELNIFLAVFIAYNLGGIVITWFGRNLLV